MWLSSTTVNGTLILVLHLTVNETEHFFVQHLVPALHPVPSTDQPVTPRSNLLLDGPCCVRVVQENTHTIYAQKQPRASRTTTHESLPVNAANRGGVYVHTGCAHCQLAGRVGNRAACYTEHYTALQMTRRSARPEIK